MCLVPQGESAAAMTMAKSIIPKLGALEGLELIVPVTKCSNIFTFRATNQTAATEAGRVRFTESLQRSNIRVSTGPWLLLHQQSSSYTVALGGRQRFSLMHCLRNGELRPRTIGRGPAEVAGVPTDDQPIPIALRQRLSRRSLPRRVAGRLSCRGGA